MTHCKRYMTVDHDKTGNPANADVRYDDTVFEDVIYQGYVKSKSTRSDSQQIRFSRMTRMSVDVCCVSYVSPEDTCSQMHFWIVYFFPFDSVLDVIENWTERSRKYLSLFLFHPNTISFNHDVLSTYVETSTKRKYRWLNVIMKEDCFQVSFWYWIQYIDRQSSNSITTGKRCFPGDVHICRGRQTRSYIM